MLTVIALGIAVAIGLIPRDTSEIPGVAAVAFGIAFVVSGAAVGVAVVRSRGPRLLLTDAEVVLRRMGDRDVRCVRPDILSVNLRKVPVVRFWVLTLDCVGSETGRLLLRSSDYPAGIDALGADLDRWRASRRRP